MSERTAKEIFGEALDVPLGERAEWLGERCGSDGSLLERVQELLAAHERAAAVLGNAGAEAPFRLDVPANLLARAFEYAPGDLIGPYRIVRRAGRGGFGTVYLAEQREPVERRVALKVLHMEQGSEAALARFDAERQALARMEHPAIARVFDAGATEFGQPYFAMEFVSGVPITEHCRAAGMDLAGVLQLFRVVCQAVHHAHEKGVVHRDLKPSNVLVTEVDGAPFPKVIDFGIAKAIDRPLTELSLVSVAGEMIGTPAYMSPEQAAAKSDVDTRTDVYALGVLLYELVCGRAPFEADTLGFVGLMRAIAEVEPPLPSRRLAQDKESSTIRFVPPDLDWIAMRCLEKDRARRYESAFALARDVGRFLDGLPVDAAPPGAWYRLTKLARRHRVAFVAACAVLLAIVGGGFGTGIGFVRAKRANAQLTDVVRDLHEQIGRKEAAQQRAAEEALRAVQQSEVARAVNDFLTQDLLASAIPSAERGRGRDVLLRDVLDVAAESLDSSQEQGGRFEGKPVVEAAVRATLGIVYDELGELEAAARHTRRAAELRDVGLGASEPLTLETWSRLGGLFRQMQRFEEADELLVASREGLSRTLGPDAPRALIATQRLGMLRYNQGRIEEAYRLLKDGHDVAVASHGATNSVALELLGALAIAAEQSARYEEAESCFRDALRLRREAQSDAHPDTLAAIVNLATFLRATHRYDEAQALLQEVLETHRDVLGGDHPATGTALFNLAALELERGRAEEAEQTIRRALTIFESSFDASHMSVLKARALLARCLEGRADPVDVEALFRSSLEDTLRAVGEDHPLTDARRKDLAGFLYPDETRNDEVLELMQQSFASQLRRMGPDHPNTLRAMENLSLMHSRAGEFEAAEELLQRAVAGFRRKLGPVHVETLETESALVGLFLTMERFDEALDLARHTVEAGSEHLDEDDYDLARFHLRLALALDGTGRRDEAREVVETTHATLLRTRGPSDPLTDFAQRQLAEWLPEE